MELVGMLMLIPVVAAIILLPLLRPRAEAAGAEDAADLRAGQARGEADGARIRALAAIKELEFDYATGKIDEGDYTMLRARYDVKALETLRPETQRAEGTPSIMDDLTARLEAEIRAARGRRFCAACGGELPRAARFCPACGSSVEVRA